MKLDPKDIEKILSNCKIYKKLLNYNFDRLHMPGHKGLIKIFPDSLSGVYPFFDVTETDEFDNLLDPKGAILEFLYDIKSYFNSYFSFVSLQGSTHLLQSIIFGLSKPFDTIVIARDSHKSIYEAAKLMNLRVEYIYPDYDNQTGITTYYNIENFEKTIKNSNAKYIFITSPSYFGIIQNIDYLSTIAHKYKKSLIVDEAHGAHLKFLDGTSSFDLGADITVQSMHKTLPCPTQSAMIHIKKIDELEKLKKTLISLHTTSPSYILLLLTEYGFQFAKKYAKELFSELYCKLYDIFNPIYQNTNWKYQKIDWTKVVLFLNSKTSESEVLIKNLKDNGYITELYDKTKVLFYFTMVDALKDFSALKKVIYDIIKNDNKDFNYYYLPVPKKYIEMYEVDNFKKRTVKFIECKNTVLAQKITPYPPGIPVVVEGEEVTEDIFEYLMYLKENRIINIEEVEILDEW
ncbi:aminotransferase class V-fold PLP-dependent enzyme [Caldicellulosiruptoraceae bacterium PP1]